MNESVASFIRTFESTAIRTATAFCTAIAAVMLVAGCGSGDSSSDGDDSSAVGQVNLGIADRAWSPGHEDVGWCGETSIQMAMAYYGHEVSQEEINAAAGSPSDITEDTTDAALNALGVDYIAWDESIQDVNQYIEWVKNQLRNGYPVICGTKIYPDQNPQWYVDHLVLAVGFDSTGMILNTQLDCDGQQLISYGQLASMNEGYAFENNQSHYFARAITGIR